MSISSSDSIASQLGAATQHVQAGRQQEAEAILAQILDTHPDHEEALLQLAQLQAAQQRIAEAIATFQHLLHIAPQRTETYAQFGSLLLEHDQYAQALPLLREAYARGDRSIDLLRNLGDALTESHLPQEAAAMYAELLLQKPESAPTHALIGNAYRALNRYDEAMAHWRRALAITPEFPLIEWNLGCLLMLLGDYAAGLPLFEARLRVDLGFWPQLEQFASKPFWDGGPLNGKTILVWAEQGMGDNIMMMRYLPLLKQKGAAAVIVYCHGVLRATMLTETALVVDSANLMALDSFDCHCSMMSLPYLFKSELASIPQDVPYLRPAEKDIQKWRAQLSQIRGLKVGIAWSGSKGTNRDSLRNIALRKFAPLLDVAGVQFISLQKDDSDQQLQQLTESGQSILNWMDASDDLLDTAALIAQLDLVISVDTVIVHMAGALGKPVWLLNRYESEWRWLTEGETSPWYPTVRIFRQPAIHDWDSVIAMILTELRKLAAHEEKPAEGGLLSRVKNWFR
jgi:tetratricopeptide (TPR) repeat protein